MAIAIDSLRFAFETDAGSHQALDGITLEIPEGSFTDVDRQPFTAKDIRFTYKAPYLYAHVLSWPEDGNVQIEYLRDGFAAAPDDKTVRKRTPFYHGDLVEAKILGSDAEVTFTRNVNYLDLHADGVSGNGFPVCIRFTID